MWLMPDVIKDNDNVGLAAQLLDVSEFKIFEQAYRLWFGQVPDLKSTEDFFSNYLRGGIAPYWVRDMSRKVLDKCRRGSCEPEDFGLKRPEGDPETKARGQWYIIMLVIGLSAFFYMVINTPLPPF